MHFKSVAISAKVHFQTGKNSVCRNYCKVLVKPKIQAFTSIMPPKMRIRLARMKEPGKILQRVELNELEVTYEFAYNDSEHFMVCFSDVFDNTPTEYIANTKVNLTNGTKPKRGWQKIRE